MALTSLLIKARETLSKRADELFVPVGDADKNKIILFFSISGGRRRARVGQVMSDSFAAAWKQGASMAQRWARRYRVSARWLRVDWVTAVEPMSWQELNADHIEKTKRSFFRYGIAFDADFQHAFLEQELNGNAMLYRGAKVPHAKFNKNNFMRYARIRYGERVDLSFEPNTLVFKFSTQGLFVAEDASLKNISVYEQSQWLAAPSRNVVLLQIDELAPEQVYQLILSGSEFLTKQVNKDGKFIYGYFPCFGRKIPTYNTLRHASTIYSMVEALELTRDEDLLASIQRALNYLATEIIHLYPQDDGSVLAYNVDINDEIKLGANAVSLLAMVKYTEVTGDEQYLSLMESLALGIARMQDAQTGKFVHILNAHDLSVQSEFRTIYYDGEAAFGLMRLYGLTKDPRWLAIVEKGFDYFIAADHWKAHDHWLSYCANELTLYKPEEKYFQFGVKNIADHLDFIINRITTFPTLLELSMAFYNMLERIKQMPEMMHVLDGLDVPKFYRAMHARAHYLLNGFFWPEFAMYYARPAEILGSFFIRHHAFRVRIDDVEHYLSGYIAYWKMLKAEEKKEEKKKAIQPSSSIEVSKSKAANLLSESRINRQYYFCNINFGWQLTGIEHSSIKRANLFIDHLGITPTMLTRSLNTEAQEIWTDLKKQGVVNPQLPLMNMYEELLHINEGKHLPPQKIAYDSQWQLIDVENTPTPHQRVRHPDGRMRMYIVWRDQQKTRANYINYFYDGRKIQRDKFNRFGQLMVSQYLGAKEEVLKEDCFTPDGRRVLSRHFGGEPRRLRLIQWQDEATQRYHTFEDEEALATVWLEQCFAGDMPRVFFIDRHRSWAVPLHQFNKNKKHILISVVHSIHIGAPYEDFEQGRLNSNYRDVLQERVSVNHCIVLTPQQKQDVRARFGTAGFELECIRSEEHTYELQS